MPGNWKLHVVVRHCCYLCRFNLKPLENSPLSPGDEVTADVEGVEHDEEGGDGDDDQHLHEMTISYPVQLVQKQRNIYFNLQLCLIFYFQETKNGSISM